MIQPIVKAGLRSCILLAAMSMLSLMSCQAPIGPVANREATAVPAEQVVQQHSTTDREGRVHLHDPLASADIEVTAQDADTKSPLQSIEIYFISSGARFMAISIDPGRRYLPAWYEGPYSRSASSSFDEHGLLGVMLPQTAQAQSLQSINQLMKLKDLAATTDIYALAKNQPQLLKWNLLYEDRCWTGDQLAEFASIAGIVIQGGADIVLGPEFSGLDSAIKAVVGISMHVAEEDFRQKLHNSTHRFKIRNYRLLPSIIPVSGFVPLGYCDVLATSVPTPTIMPTITQRPLEVRSPTPLSRTTPGSTRTPGGSGPAVPREFLGGWRNQGGGFICGINAYGTRMDLYYQARFDMGCGERPPSYWVYAGTCPNGSFNAQLFKCSLSLSGRDVVLDVAEDIYGPEHGLRKYTLKLTATSSTQLTVQAQVVDTGSDSVGRISGGTFQLVKTQ